MARVYRKVHDPLLMTYLLKHFPPATFRTNVRLGAIDLEFFPEAKEPKMKELASIYLPRADAVVILPEKVIIIEVMVRNEFWKLEQLAEYGRLFKITEEFREHWHKPIELQIVTPKYNKYLEERALRYRIKVVIFSEIFWELYAATLPGRTREGRFKGTIKLPPPEEGRGSPPPT